jgi:hypothetical protein
MNIHVIQKLNIHELYLICSHMSSSPHFKMGDPMSKNKAALARFWYEMMWLALLPSSPQLIVTKSAESN